MAGVSVTNRAIWDTPAADLVNNARAVFVGTGGTSDQVQALMENPYYSLSVLTALATGITRLQGLTGRDAVLVFAAAAQSEDEANFVATVVRG
jgi:hypothetical protein